MAPLIVTIDVVAIWLDPLNCTSEPAGNIEITRDRNRAAGFTQRQVSPVNGSIAIYVAGTAGQRHCTGLIFYDIHVRTGQHTDRAEHGQVEIGVKEGRAVVVLQINCISCCGCARRIDYQRATIGTTQSKRSIARSQSQVGYGK